MLINLSELSMYASESRLVIMSYDCMINSAEDEGETTCTRQLWDIAKVDLYVGAPMLFLCLPRGLRVH